ncbi:diguanylate cyclase [Silvimonas sp.]|uniref:sensor domain-containing diguanylate cyclase n=1 Tax=Silvimonas sp. TaxID=2650811 RepID=UPI00284D3216|nr:diguanylate cyclase [Silvimonas sp.]MDR3427506.1 diguanylate cyclase [Silvimonas sp.]
MTKRRPTVFASLSAGRRTERLVLLAATTLFIGGLVCGFYRFNQNLATEYGDVSDASAYAAVHLEYALETRRQSVEMLAEQAAELMSGRYSLNLQPTLRLDPRPDHHGYVLGALPGFTKAELGQLSGEGPMPPADSPLAREMAMAIALTPLLKALEHRDADLPLIYYQSASGFAYVYPALGADTSGSQFYRRSDEQQAAYAKAAPQANPQRQTIWTRAAPDFEHKEQTATVSAPLYVADQFLGVISRDVKLATLVEALVLRKVPYSSLTVVNASGRNLLHPEQPKVSVDVLQRPPGTPVRAGKVSYTVYPLSQAGWFMVTITDHPAILLGAASDSLLLIGAIIASLLSVTLLVLLAGALRDNEKLSIQDGLTGLYNRRHFDIIAQREFGRSLRDQSWLGLAILDVDFFKKYNDHYGHQAGDQVLRSVSEALRQALQRATDGVFRVGGEEFAVLVPLEAPDQFDAVLERIVVGVRDLDIPHEKSDWPQLTVSVGGVAIGPGQPLSLDAAYSKADEALYQAKMTGRNRYVVAALAGDGKAPALSQHVVAEPIQGRQKS